MNASSALAKQSGLSPLTQMQYNIQNQWIQQNQLSQSEIIMSPEFGLSSATPAPNTTYLTLISALMVGD